MKFNASETVRPSGLRAGDRVLLPAHLEWGWAIIVDIETTSEAGLMYFVSLLLDAGVPERPVRQATWVSGCRTVRRQCA